MHTYIAHEYEHNMGFYGGQLPHDAHLTMLGTIYRALIYDVVCAGCSGAFINEVLLLAVSPRSCIVQVYQFNRLSISSARNEVVSSVCLAVFHGTSSHRTKSVAGTAIHCVQIQQIWREAELHYLKLRNQMVLHCS